MAPTDAAPPRLMLASTPTTERTDDIYKQCLRDSSLVLAGLRGGSKGHFLIGTTVPTGRTCSLALKEALFNSANKKQTPTSTTTEGLRSPRVRWPGNARSLGTKSPFTFTQDVPGNLSLSHAVDKLQESCQNPPLLFTVAVLQRGP